MRRTRIQIQQRVISSGHQCHIMNWLNLVLIIQDSYGERLMELSDWMIDVHKTLRRTRNTAYAYEGIIHAYQMGQGQRLFFKSRKIP